MKKTKKNSVIALPKFFAIIFFFGATAFSFAQESEVETDSIVIVQQTDKELKVMQGKIDNAEKEAKKAQRDAKRAENEQKKLEKEAERLEDLKDDVTDKKEDIAKIERKINKLQEDMQLDKIKGKLSPNDIDKINKKIEKEKLKVFKEQKKLRKLERKLQMR